MFAQCSQRSRVVCHVSEFSSFLRMNDCPFYVFTTLSMPSSISGYLGRYNLLGIMSQAINMGVPICLGPCLRCFRGTHPEVEWLDQRVLPSTARFATKGEQSQREEMTCRTRKGQNQNLIYLSFADAFRVSPGKRYTEANGKWSKLIWVEIYLEPGY